MKQLLVRSEVCVGCKSCELACAVAHSQSKTLIGAFLEPVRPKKRVFVETDGRINFPLQCRQCSDRPCVHACMAGAMHLDPTTGLVQVNPEKCVGCWMCVMVCPFGAITEGPSHQAVKCDRCRELDYEPACVSACPTKALQWVDVDHFAAVGRRSWVDHLKEANHHA
ncbi:MAG: 4Fe-4S dicluster domain-containing protein [Desulfitobacteriaceae bacterium]|nr:4Fe-4S dicluster domain-containing protein [Desulfitobacteriaceae bacterium]MDI6914302.1 4Fe-4S dicluster domain-containing protein [Desulfitobacteriaceae bacterium]